MTKNAIHPTAAVGLYNSVWMIVRKKRIFPLLGYRPIVCAYMARSMRAFLGPYSHSQHRLWSKKVEKLEKDPFGMEKERKKGKAELNAQQIINLKY